LAKLIDTMAIFEGRFDFFMNMVKGGIGHRATGQKRQAIKSELIEQVVDNTDTNMRLIIGYKKKLRHAVESSFEYIDALVETIPGPVDVNRHTFSTDPQVNAFFVNVEDLQVKFSRSPELRDFIEQNSVRELNDIFALLCMEKKEKTVYGVELEGDIIRRDVPQVGVSFSDHQLLSPAHTESQVREGLRHCLFDGLVTEAVERLKLSQSKVERLQDQKRRLQIMLRNARAKRHGSISGEKAIPVKSAELQRLLAENERALIASKTGLGTPEDSLKQVNGVFENPDQYIKVDNVELKINKMGIKLNEKSQESANEIHLAQVAFGETPSRVVLLARYPSSEILPKEDFLQRMNLYLR
jgi:hypothetical protein